MEPTSASSYASNLWTSSSNTSSTPSTSSSKSKPWAQCSRQAKAKSGGTRSDGTMTLGLGAAMSPCLAALASTCCAARPLLQPNGAKKWRPRTCTSVPTSTRHATRRSPGKMVCQAQTRKGSSPELSTCAGHIADFIIHVIQQLHCSDGSCSLSGPSANVAGFVLAAPGQCFWLRVGGTAGCGEVHLEGRP